MSELFNDMAVCIAIGFVAVLAGLLWAGINIIGICVLLSLNMNGHANSPWWYLSIAAPVITALYLLHSLGRAVR